MKRKVNYGVDHNMKKFNEGFKEDEVKHFKIKYVAPSGKTTLLWAQCINVENNTYRLKLVSLSISVNKVELIMLLKHKRLLKVCLNKDQHHPYYEPYCLKIKRDERIRQLYI